jgi:hypothetical protein
VAAVHHAAHYRPSLTHFFQPVYQDGLGKYSQLTWPQIQRQHGQPYAGSKWQHHSEIFRSGLSHWWIHTAGASGSIGLDALEDFTATNQGTIWRFLNNPVAGNTRQEVANISVANGVTATQFNTTGNVTAGNLTLSTGGIVYRALV